MSLTHRSLPTGLRVTGVAAVTDALVTVGSVRGAWCVSVGRGGTKLDDGRQTGRVGSGPTSSHVSSTAVCRPWITFTPWKPGDRGPHRPPRKACSGGTYAPREHVGFLIRETRDPPTIGEVQRLLDAASGPLRVFLRLSANTGARRGEVLAIQRGDVDLGRPRVVIRRSVAHTPETGLTVRETKTGRRGTTGPSASAAVWSPTGRPPPGPNRASRRTSAT
jgi:hypothetical protein